MDQLQRETVVALRSRSGLPIAQIRLLDRQGASIQVLAEAEASEHGEEPIQILESRSYDFELEAPLSCYLEETPLIQPNRANSRLGRIEPGLNTGLLALRLIDADGVPVASAGIEVRTNKIDYRSEYRSMLNDLAATSAGLLMDFRGAAQARMAADPHVDVETLHQQFVVIRALLTSEEMSDAIDQLLGAPHRRWISEETEVDARRGLRPGARVTQQIVRGGVRLDLPQTHPLAGTMRRFGVAQPSLPKTFRIDQPGDTVDTPENRFVKFALEDFELFLEGIEARLLASGAPADRRLLREVTPMRRSVSAWLSHEFFAEIGPAELLPLGSPVLQRRAGYREVLNAWLTFQLATKLEWRGGDDVFGAGKRDVAVLYEYWVFFKLLALVMRVFELDAPPHQELLEGTEDGLDLRLRSGQTLAFTGFYKRGTRVLGVRFSYNRTFSRRAAKNAQSNYPEEGSWTKPMRPDYTLSLWPAEFKLSEAERQELVVHVHFDAKYRVDDITTLFGGDGDDEVQVEEDALRRGTAPKRADLLKMHAYRDAIRRTEGAYVLYPGRDPAESRDWLAFSEILPGLGAFALRPTAEETSLALLETFLSDIADYVCSETTRLEQQTYHLFRIQEPSGDFRWHVQLPRLDKFGKRLRKRPRGEL